MSNVLFIGRSTLDVISVVSSFPKTDSKSKAIDNFLGAGGSALNAAVTCSWLGANVTLLTSLGRDCVAKSIVEDDLKRHQVNYIDVCEEEDYEIPVSSIISSIDDAARLVVNAAQEECKDVNYNLSVFEQSFDLVLIDQYERHFVEKYRDKIKGLGCPIILDGGSEKPWSEYFLQLADIPIVSEKFKSVGIESYLSSFTSSEGSRAGFENWAITLGQNGVRCFSQGKVYDLPACEVDAVDTLGAGDIFHGAFCYYYAENHDFLNAIEQAKVIAAKACTQMGTRSWMK
ncbi:PfkB family carbohydrate kinase [Vibrio nigripulchritudo]|uniref:PfkB family carbohydrate kinase n=2 Tax=Vibrio nigripulchritudo TaxID=28173 RepID=UPI00190DD668|nr:PfkB family carbohydrate kinase [Vibrio nigripulchritudo]